MTDLAWRLLLDAYPDPADIAQREIWRRDPAQWAHDRLGGAHLWSKQRDIAAALGIETGAGDE